MRASSSHVAIASQRLRPVRNWRINKHEKADSPDEAIGANVGGAPPDV
jgi:hypothetical protein